MSIICTTCEQEFETRAALVQQLLFDGQVVSKGSRPSESTESYDCGHLKIPN